MPFLETGYHQPCYIGMPSKMFASHVAIGCSSSPLLLPKQRERVAGLLSWRLSGYAFCLTVDNDSRHRNGGAPTPRVRHDAISARLCGGRLDVTIAFPIAPYGAFR